MWGEYGGNQWGEQSVGGVAVRVQEKLPWATENWGFRKLNDFAIWLVEEKEQVLLYGVGGVGGVGWCRE